MNYSDMTVAELRPLAGELAQRLGIPTTPIRVTWSKEQLVSFLATQGAATPQAAPTPEVIAARMSAPEHTIGVISPTTHTAPATDSSTDLARIIREIAAGAQQQAAPLDEAAINALIDARISGITVPVRYEVVNPPQANVITDYTHNKFPSILRKLSIGQHLALVGAAGSGKTHCMAQAAAALNRPFYSTSVSSQTTKSDILGYVTATGEVVSTPFREAFTDGGVFCFDELDAGNGNTITCINSALGNGSMTFPGGTLPTPRHPDFVCGATMNTWGRGASRIYVGRNSIDGASIDRFAFVAFDYDEVLERAIALAAGATAVWVDRVQALRRNLDRLYSAGSIRSEDMLVISPRASINGGRELSAGAEQSDVENEYIWRGASQTIIDRVKRG